MFVILVKYVRPIEEIEAQLVDHRRFLDEQYASGHFLASGPQVPRTGGVILARGGSREEVERIVATDPFRLAGVAEYEVIEFTPTKLAPELSGVI